MKAIVRQQYGGPEQLCVTEVPDPVAGKDEVLVRVRAFGINRAEQYFRQGHWGDVAAISGIECAGEVVRDPSGKLQPGQRVFALMGGMGRSRSGSYAELVAVPAVNVVPIRSALGWSELAAIPESYATAWSCLFDNLALRRHDQRVDLGEAAVLVEEDAGERDEDLLGLGHLVAGDVHARHRAAAEALDMVGEPQVLRVSRFSAGEAQAPTREPYPRTGSNATGAQR